MTHEHLDPSLPERDTDPTPARAIGPLAMGEYAKEQMRQHDDIELLPIVEHDSYFGGKVQVVEARPVRPPTNEDVPHDGPAVYYAHGAGWGYEEPTVEEMARLGRDAFSFTVTGDREADPTFMVGHTDQDGLGALHDASKREVKKLVGTINTIVPKQQMREAATLLGLIEERNEGPVDAVLQSESAGHGIIAAYTDPSKFRSLVLAFPGNFEPQTGFIPGRIREDAKVRRQHLPAVEDSFTTPRSKLESARALLEQVRSPGFSQEAAGLRFASLAPLLHSMRQREEAPGVTLVAGLDDKIFVWERYFQTLVSSKDVDAIVFVPGGHAVGGRKAILKQILDQFPAMEARDESEWLKRPLRDRIFLPEGVSDEVAQAIVKQADELDAKSTVVSIN